MPKTKQPKPRILYTKIKYSKGRVQLNYTEKVEEYFNELSMNMSQIPQQSFIDAMNALAEDCLELCEINNKKEKLAERVEVHTISINYESEKEIPGMTISFKIKRTNRAGAININTPYILLEPRTDNEAEDVLNEEAAERIHDLLDEADKYRNGDRQNYEFKFQTEPELEEDPKEPEKKIKQETSDSSVNGSGSLITNGKVFELGGEDYVVKLNENMKGAIRPGIMMQLTELVNYQNLLSINGRKGIYNLNPGEKVKATNDEGKKKNAFSFKRNGNVLLIEEFMDKPIIDFVPADLNNKIMEVLQLQFHEPLKITLEKSFPKF